MNKNNALLVFGRNLELGKVKTRLKPELSDEECVTIYKAMVNDLVKNIRTDEHYDVLFFFTPANAKKKLQKWLGHEFKFVPQSDGNLGIRMSAAFNWAFKNKYKRAILIGTDLPTIDQKLILHAFRELESSDVVLGPSTDGGYYLIGMKNAQPQIFNNIHWSSETVLNETLGRIKETNLTFALLEVRTDIDSYADVLQLWTMFTIESDLSERLSETYSCLHEIIDAHETETTPENQN